MIKTKSPHYKSIPWISPSSGTTPDKYILNIYVCKYVNIVIIVITMIIIITMIYDMIIQ